MRKLLLPKITAILITTLIATTVIYACNFAGGKLVRKMLLEDEQVVKVLNYINESGVKKRDVRIVIADDIEYLKFFIFIFLLVLFFLGTYHISTKITAKFFKLNRQN